MFCNHCGTEQQDLAKFCHSCGKPVEAPADPQPVSTPTHSSPPVSKVKPTAPEIGLLLGMVLTPFGGAVIYSQNWTRLGRPSQNQIITWVTASVAFLIGLFAGWILMWLIWGGWNLGIYFWQRNQVEREIRSTGALVGGILAFVGWLVLIVLLFVVGAALYFYNGLTNGSLGL